MNQNYFVTKAYILTQVSQEVIFEFYFNNKIDLSKKYKSPLRSDPSPGCSFFYGQSGDLLFFDSKEGNMDCFKFIMMKYNCSYYDAIMRIKIDLKILQSKQVEIINEEKEPYLKKIQIKKKPYTLEELKYWQLPDLEVTEKMLIKHKIFSISDLWFNGVYKGYNLNFTFAYKQTKPYSYQIYKPFEEKTKKFRTNDGSYIYGLDELDLTSDEVNINKGPKDKFYATLAGYNSIGPIGEGFNIPEETMIYLRDNFKRIYLCYDNDDAGRRYVNKIIKQYPFVIPRFPLVGKDFSDMAKEKGVAWVKENW